MKYEPTHPRAVLRLLRCNRCDPVVYVCVGQAMNKDSRHPYTYACDFIRSLAGHEGGSTKLSRADASAIRSGIAKAIHMDDAELAEALSNYFCANQESITEETVRSYTQSVS